MDFYAKSHPNGGGDPPSRVVHACLAAESLSDELLLANLANVMALGGTVAFQMNDETVHFHFGEEKPDEEDY